MLLGLVAAKIAEDDPEFRQEARIAVDTWLGERLQEGGAPSDVGVRIRRHIMHLLDNPDVAPVLHMLQSSGKRTWKRCVFEWLERGWSADTRKPRPSGGLLTLSPPGESYRGVPGLGVFCAGPGLTLVAPVPVPVVLGAVLWPVVAGELVEAVFGRLSLMAHVRATMANTATNAMAAQEPVPRPARSRMWSGEFGLLRFGLLGSIGSFGL
jgi:hypothetical protein